MLTDDKPAAVGWLHYRLAVAFCASVLMALMLLIVPGFVLMLGPNAPTARMWNLYPYVFSEWGAGILVATAIFGFAAGSERTASFFAFLWGTHPFWSRLAQWLEEHETAAAVIGWLLVALTVGFFWYAFRYTTS